MDAYIYQAAYYCPDCIEKIKARLKSKGKKPADPDDERSYDSNQWPKGPLADGGGESDRFEHCNACHVFLDNALTGDGVKYTIEQLAEYVDDVDGNAEVLDEWAEALESYSLGDHEKFVLTAYNKIRKLEKKLAPTK